MSIANQLNSMITYLEDAYRALEYKQVILPENKNFKNLADAIASITTGAKCYESLEELAQEEAANGTLAIVYKMYQPDESGYKETDYFYGIYLYTDGVWTIAPTQLDAKSCHLIEGVGYGANGIINIGTFTSNYCHNKYEVMEKINIWQAVSNKTLDARNLPVLAWSYENVDFSIGNYYAPNVILPANPTNMQGMFANTNIVDLELMPIVNTDMVTDMSYLFYQVNSPKLVNFLTDFGLNTYYVANMAYMFAGCQNANIIHDIANTWDLITSRVGNMQGMFAGINNLGIAPVMETGNTRDMSYMFYGNNGSKLTTIPAYQTNLVSNMAYMFYNCQELTHMPELNLYSVSNAHNMFGNAVNLKVIPSACSFISLLDGSSQFMNCTNLINAPAFGAQIKYANNMFRNCYNLTTIQNIVMNNVINIEDMFYQCNNLINLGYLNNLGRSFYYNTLDDSNINIQTLNLQAAANLSYNSIKNVIAGMYNLKSINKQGRIIINSATNNLMSVSDRTNITNKGWTYLVQ